jgi:hypothetical protein
MKSKMFRNISTSVLILLTLLTGNLVNASTISQSDLDKLKLGAKIVGPVGPEVEVSLVDSLSDSIGDLASSVSCPVGMQECNANNNPSDTIYTYRHTVTPGIDLPNDAPFPNPKHVKHAEGLDHFRLGFEALGFTGVAGYSYNQADVANLSFALEVNSDGQLVWSVDKGTWDKGEAITFFWQTTQAPSGPSGTFTLGNDSQSGTGQGPHPTLILGQTAAEVPAPLSFSLILMAILYLFARDRKAIRRHSH